MNTSFAVCFAFCLAGSLTGQPVKRHASTGLILNQNTNTNSNFNINQALLFLLQLSQLFSSQFGSQSQFQSNSPIFFSPSAMNATGTPVQMIPSLPAALASHSPTPPSRLSTRLSGTGAIINSNTNTSDNFDFLTAQINAFINNFLSSSQSGFQSQSQTPFFGK